MSRYHTSVIGNIMERRVASRPCPICKKKNSLKNLNDIITNHQGVDLQCANCHRVFQIKSSEEKSNLRTLDNGCFRANLFRRHIVRQALADYGTNYHIIGIIYKVNRNGDCEIIKMVLSTGDISVIERDSSVDAVEFTGKEIV